jgi:hypothetical protein
VVRNVIIRVPVKSLCELGARKLSRILGGNG